MVNRTNIEHPHTVTQAFLALLDRDIQAGVNVQPLPKDWAKFMLTQIQRHPDVDLDEELEGNEENFGKQRLKALA